MYLIGCVLLCSCELGDDFPMIHYFAKKCLEDSHYDKKAGNYRNLIVYGVGLHVDTLAECTLTLGDHVSKEYTVHGFPLSCFSCYLGDRPSLLEVVEQLQDTVDFSSVYEMAEITSNMEVTKSDDSDAWVEHRIYCLKRMCELETEDLEHNLKFIFYINVSVANRNFEQPTIDGISVLLSKIIDQNANDTIDFDFPIKLDTVPHLMVRGDDTRDSYPRYWEATND